MLEFDYIIIGGGIAGTTAAETLRKSSPDFKIAILESEPNPLYSKVLIPSYLKNKITREKLFLRKFSDYESQKINLFSGTSVKDADFAGRKIYAEDPEGKEKNFSYKKLLIAAGGTLSSNLQPPTSNSQPPLRMQTITDADRIKEALEKHAGGSVAVIGESFIALEFLDIFLTNNFKVHAASRGDYFAETRLGKTGAQMLEENFKNKGIVLHKNTEKNFSEKINADVVAAGVGLKRDLGIFSGIDKNAGIVTDEFLKTSVPDVFAAGDIVEYYDLISENKRLAGNWTTAFLQGRIAALNILASNNALMSPFRAVPSYGLGSLGYHLAFIGDTEDAEEIKEEIGETADGTTPTFLRLFLKDGRIKGAAMINRYTDKAVFAKLIEEKTIYGGHQKIFA